MKKSLQLDENWEVCWQEADGGFSIGEFQSSEESGGWLTASMPAQAHDVLWQHDRLPDPRVLSSMKACQWVAKKDWLYRTRFAKPDGGERVYLHFKGLDTLCDVYLNGELIGSHEDQYLPLRIDITANLKDDNALLLHFKSPVKYLDDYAYPEEWGESIPPQKVLRKAGEEFGTFLGAKPAFIKIGIFDDVLLEIADAMEIEELAVLPSYTLDENIGRVKIEVLGKGFEDHARVEVVLKDMEGKAVASEAFNVQGDSENWTASGEISLQEPALWWPKFYGPQNLYTVEVTLRQDENIFDQQARRIGFRELTMESPFDFAVNGKKVKLWGANLCPTDGRSHVKDMERWRQTLDMAENANCVTLRAWGPGAPYPDYLFDECDRRGFLLWGEFFHTWGRYPEDDHFRALCRAEAEYYVKSHRHRPSIILWCGANETHMGAAMMHHDKPYFGKIFFEEDYREICERLDPERYYHPSSPSGGAFPNDPLEGDSHSYTHGYYLPGEEFPVLFSENTRIAPPQIHSTRRYLEGDTFWPDGFNGMIRKRDDTPMPQSWMERTLGNGFWYGRPGEMGLFYNTCNTPEGLIYRMGAAYEHYLRNQIERMRRGRRGEEDGDERRSLGHYLWKLNATWPQIYGEMIDYYLEPTMAYYAMRRIHRPLLLSFEISWHIWLWVVNDTGDDIEGEVVFQLWDMEASEAAEELRSEVKIKSGQSRVIMNLDEIGMIPQHMGLFAKMLDSGGKVLARANSFVDVERRLDFPEARLEMTQDNDALVITTDKFARCVELTGDADGDRFGWFFEDNFFDLYPGETKRVRLLGRHRAGMVTAKSFWSPHVCALKLK